MDQEQVFRSAKNWSDFVGFHVRMSFLMVLALVGLMPAIVRFMIAFDAGQDYSVQDHLVEVAFFLFMMALALVMFWKIIRVVFRYVSGRGWSRPIAAAVVALVLAAEGFLTIVILRTTYLQALNLNAIEREHADRIGEEIWRAIRRGSLRSANIGLRNRELSAAPYRAAARISGFSTDNSAP